jgi:hypothetical protein
MRTRDKQRTFKRFMAGESVCDLAYGLWARNISIGMKEIEDILREGLAGKLDPLPMKQARKYAAAAGVKVGRMVKV